MNKLSHEQVTILTEGEEISNDFAKVWKKVAVVSKIVIGEGTFGKILLALALSLSEKPGEAGNMSEKNKYCRRQKKERDRLRCYLKQHKE